MAARAAPVTVTPVISRAERSMALMPTLPRSTGRPATLGRDAPATAPGGRFATNLVVTTDPVVGAGKAPAARRAPRDARPGDEGGVLPRHHDARHGVVRQLAPRHGDRVATGATD